MVTCLSAQPTKQNDLERRFLRGNVKSIIEKKISETDTIPKRINSHGSEYHFNVKGYIACYTSSFLGSNGLVSEYTTYDSLNNKVSDSSDRYKSTILNDYDSVNRLVKKSYFDSKQQLLAFDTYEYNQDGYLIRLDRYTEHGKLKHKSIYTYDKQNAVTVKNYTPRGNLTSITKYDKNFSNNKLYESRYSESQWYTWEYKYDIKGQMVTASTIQKNRRGIIKYRYNEYGDKVSEIGRSLNLKHLSKYETIILYEYDEHDNWIKKTSITNKEKIETVTREITYY